MEPLDVPVELVQSLRNDACRADESCIISSDFVEWLRVHAVDALDPGSDDGNQRLMVAGRLGRTLARTCPSAAWLGVLFILHRWLSRRFGFEAQRAINQGTRIPLIAAGFRPTGTAERRGTTYRLNGKWDLVSGAHYADWMLVNASVSSEEDARFFLVEAKHARVLRNEALGGLRGSGSDSVLLEDVDVDTIFSLPERVLRSPEAPGSTPDSDPLLRCQVQPVLAMIGCSVIVGAGEGIFEALLQDAHGTLGSKVDKLARPAERTLLRIGEAHSNVVEAGLIWELAMSRLLEYCHGIGDEGLHGRLEYRLSVAQVARHAWEGTVIAREVLGTKASMLARNVEISIRALQTLRSHHLYRWDETMVMVGEAYLGGKTHSMNASCARRARPPPAGIE